MQILVFIRSKDVSSLPAARVDQDRHWAIINQGDLHICTKRSGFNWTTQIGAKNFEEPLIESFGLLGRSGMSKRRPGTLLGAGVQGELANDKTTSTDIHKGPGHLSIVRVFENSEPSYLARKPDRIIFRVAALDTEQEE